MNQEIMNKVQKQYNTLIEQYSEDRILWVAAVGPGIYDQDNYHIIEVSACILPTEDELYTVYPNIKENILDIRLLIDGIEKHSETWIEMILSPYKIINPKYKEILNHNLFINKEILFLSNNKDIISILKNSIKSIIISSFDLPSQEQELVKILTKTELQVLKLIIKDFQNNNEGDIKVSQATEKYNISTSVFRTLFYKIKEYSVAAIDSRGVKGTHICFNNIEKLKSLID